MTGGLFRTRKDVSMARKNTFGYTPQHFSKFSIKDCRMICELKESEYPERIFASAVGLSRAQAWAKQHGLVLSGGMHRIGIKALNFGYRDYRSWFVGMLICKERRREFAKADFDLPLDHVEAWRRPNSRELVCVTSQPYGISSKDVVGLARLVTDFGLCVEILQANAWYFTSRAELIEIWRSPTDMVAR